MKIKDTNIFNTVGQDVKFSDTRGKDFYWSPTRRSLVGDQKSFPWVSEIFPSCPLTGVRSFMSFHQKYEKMKIKDTNIFNTVGFCI
jgi:hypothetical protein